MEKTILGLVKLHGQRTMRIGRVRESPGIWEAQIYGEREAISEGALGRNSHFY